MKLKVLCSLIFLSLLFIACGGGGGDTASESGTVSMSITDAKPLLPENVTNFYVEFSEIWVHKSGEGWEELPLVESPYTIDLLQFQDGNTTEFVPPTILNSGKYSQVRFVVSNAMIRIDNQEDLVVEIPSENLKTDKNFTIDVESGTAVDLVVHFDLSMSLVVSGNKSDPVYKLKPVLHLFDDPIQAATISGAIDNESFGESEEATITVFLETSQEIFTQVVVPKSADTGPAEFNIFWIVPDKSYTVEIDLDQDGLVDCSEFVQDVYLTEKEIFLLNNETVIELGEDICNI